MISKFRKFIENESLFGEDDKILLACSGGVDSMVLADLLLADKFQIGIAHINHQTRGKDSDADQTFVEEYCRTKSIPCYSISKPIKQMAENAKENFQAFARNFRYDYLNEIREKHQYSHIATAHHKSDTTESFFINLVRGTGLDGLTGIPIRNKDVIRPLAFANKNEIENYAKKFGIKYIEDISNQSIKYTRNFIRHEVLPKLSELNPNAHKNILATIHRLENTSELLGELIAMQVGIVQEAGESKIRKTDILKISNASILLYYTIKPYGFNYDQADQIISSIKNVGSTFHSQIHTLLVDRDYLIIKIKANKEHTLLTINSPGQYNLDSGEKLLIEETDQYELSQNQKQEYVDMDKLNFPLQLRNWKDGDKFAPIGMNGNQKKVKDYLTDIKLSRFEKENQLILLSNEEIVWVIGRRLSEKFKCDSNSKRYFRISLK